MRDLVIKCLVGAEDAERCNQAFTVASVALAAGGRVSMWLAGEAVWFAVPGRAEAFDLPLAPSLAGARDLLISDGTLTVCTQCAARRELTEADLLPGVRLAGAAGFVEEALAEGVQALVY